MLCYRQNDITRRSIQLTSIDWPFNAVFLRLKNYFDEIDAMVDCFRKENVSYIDKLISQRHHCTRRFGPVTLLFSFSLAVMRECTLITGTLLAHRCVRTH